MVNPDGGYDEIPPSEEGVTPAESGGSDQGPASEWDEPKPTRFLLLWDRIASLEHALRRAEYERVRREEDRRRLRESRDTVRFWKEELARTRDAYREALRKLKLVRETHMALADQLDYAHVEYPQDLDRKSWVASQESTTDSTSTGTEDSLGIKVLTDDQRPVVNAQESWTNDQDAQEWRSFPVSYLKLTPGVIRSLIRENLTTVGAIADWVSRGQSILTLPNIGRAKADKIATAVRHFLTEYRSFYRLSTESPGNPGDVTVDPEEGGDAAKVTEDHGSLESAPTPVVAPHPEQGSSPGEAVDAGPEPPVSDHADDSRF